MALIGCPFCQARISEFASACPKCGKSVAGWCPECGSPHAANDSNGSCRQCGFPLSGPIEPDKRSSDAGWTAISGFPQVAGTLGIDPKGAIGSRASEVVPAEMSGPGFRVGPPLSTAALEIATTELEMFLGTEPADKDDYAYYLSMWSRILSGQSRYARFNFAAWLFGPIWCVFRKMYGLALAYLVLAVAARVLVFGVLDESGGEYGLGLYLLVGLLIYAPSIGLGICANRIYLRRAIKRIEAERRQGMRSEEYLRRLASIGGTDPIGVAVAFLASFALVLFSAFR